MPYGEVRFHHSYFAPSVTSVHGLRAPPREPVARQLREGKEIVRLARLPRTDRQAVPRAVIAGQEMAARPDVAADEPLLHSARTGNTHGDQPVELTDGSCLKDFREPKQLFQL